MCKSFLLTFIIISLSNYFLQASEKPPVRGFPNSEEVLNKITPHPHPEPHLIYIKNGFDESIMHKVPPVGVHPRVDMSPQDIIELRGDLKTNEFTKRAWERVILSKIKDKKGNFQPIEKVKRLDAAALYALVSQDKEYAAKLVDQLMVFSDKVNAKLDEIDETNDYPQHWWFSVRNTGIKDLARAYDYAFNFLRKEQQSTIRAVISKATVGRYNHGMELPRSWRTWNWPQFSQDIVNVALAIEGEEGYEPRIFQVCKEAVVDFLTYKISPEGWDFEATGYNGLAYGGGGIQSIHAVARRLDPNPLMHPHLQTQIAAYIGQQNGPEGPFFGRGDAGESPPQFELTQLMRAFYPNDDRMKMLWAVSRDHHGFGDRTVGNLDHMTRGSLCIPMLIYPLNDNENHRDYWGKDKDYPLTYSTPSRGYMATRTNWDPENSVHMSFANYTKLRDTGHDGPDAGTFSVWGYGADWSRYGTKYNKSSSARSYIAVNGGGMEYGTAHGLFFPVVDEVDATAGRGDMTYSFQYKIANGRYNVLYSPLFTESPSFYTNAWTHDQIKTLRDYEPDATPFSKEFWSLASPNYGLWNGEDRHPTRRIPNIPMQRAFRSSTLVRGDSSLNNGNGYPYILTVDDIQQNDQKQSYDWLMPLKSRNLVNELVKTSGDKGDQYIIVRRYPSNKPKDAKEWPPILKKGDPLLMVKVLQRNHSDYPGIRLDTFDKELNRIVVPSNSIAPDFKVLVYPHRHGDPLPKTTWNASKTSITIEIGKQVDTIDFTKAYVDRRPFGGHGEQSYFNITRKGKKIITVGGPPSLPKLMEAERDFDDKLMVSFEKPKAGETIRYTLDGSEPTKDSTLYTKAFEIENTTTVRAITYAPNWKFGDANSRDYKEIVSQNFITNKEPTYKNLVSKIDPLASRPVSVTYTKTSPQESSVSISELSSGVDLKVYELPITIWRGSSVDLKSPLMPENLKKETPIFHSYQKSMTIPRVSPQEDSNKMYNGLYVISGYFKAHTEGRYFFNMKSAGPTRLSIGSKELINVPGPYEVAMKERQGEVYLSEGYHKFEAIFNDPSFFVNNLIPVLDFDLQVKAPDSLRYTTIQSDQLFKQKDISFNITNTILETGKKLEITNEKGGKLEVSIDGGKKFKTYRKALVFKKTANIDLQVRRKGEDQVIHKTLNVVKRIPALKDTPSMKAGMVQRRFLLPNKAEFVTNIDHNNMASTDIVFQKNPKDDIFAFAKKNAPEEIVTVTEMLPDNTGGVIRHYTGYWWAPEIGLYEFTMLNEGSNKLIIDGIHVGSNHNLDAKPEGKVILESGWHKFEIMYENSYPGIWVNMGSGSKEIPVTDFSYPANTVERLYQKGNHGLPKSFLVGSWFLKNGKVTEVDRMESTIHGSEPLKDDRKGAWKFSGDKSLIHATKISQTSEDITVSMWIKPESLKGNQYLWSRQKQGWVYSQRGGIALRLVNDRIGILYYGRNHPQTYAQVKAGEWQHVALTVKSDTTKNNATTALWLNGEKIHSEVHGHRLNIPAYYMELFAQVEREKTNPRTNDTMSYEDFKDSFLRNCYKGAASEVRFYDAALPDEAIKKLAEQ
jgi:hypothetical protein